MITAVFDCMVFLQAATSDRGPAFAAGANYLVSWDKDLTDLMDDSTFLDRYPDLQIVKPPAFLDAVRATKG